LVGIEVIMTTTLGATYQPCLITTILNSRLQNGGPQPRVRVKYSCLSWITLQL
jgi:hypothetical protein